MSFSLPPRSARSLPSHPNLEQQRKQARELLQAARALDPEALKRFRDHHPRFAEHAESTLRSARLSLHDAQLVLAREYGFASWPKLKAHIEGVSSSRRTRPFVRDPAWYDDRARGLVEVYAGGLPNAHWFVVRRESRSWMRTRPLRRVIGNGSKLSCAPIRIL